MDSEKATLLMLWSYHPVFRSVGLLLFRIDRHWGSVNPGRLGMDRAS
jgi:hypothetical protein